MLTLQRESTNINKYDLIVASTLLIDFCIIIPSLFFVNGRLWMNLFFICLYIILLSVWYWLYKYFVSKLQKIEMDKRRDLTLSMVLIIIVLSGLGFTSISVREPDYWLKWIWLIFRAISILFIAFYFLSRLSLNNKLKVKNKLDKIEQSYIISNKYWKRFERFRIPKKIGVFLCLFFLLFQTLVFFPYITIPIRPVMANKNSEEIQSTVHDIIDGINDDENKTIALLSWFERYSGNMFNTWRPPMIIPMTNNQFYFSIAIGDPYYLLVCVRNDGDNNPLWIFTSRCGNCGEHCLLFTEMAQLAGLKVRRVHVNGVDHKWNEIIIDNKSVIVDPSWVNYRDNEDGYDIENSTYERKFGNLTFVYAKWPNNKTKIDVTENYTNLSHIEITTFDEFGQPISNVTIKVFSNEFGSKINTGLVITTDETGFCILEIGGSNVTLEFSNDEKNLFNSTTRTFEEHTSYNMTINMRDIL
jgi:Transglutaminase-like superfamily